MIIVEQNKVIYRIVEITTTFYENLQRSEELMERKVANVSLEEMNEEEMI